MLSSFYEVLVCESSLPHEIVKSVLIRALLQIDRSSNRVDRDILTECILYLNIEAMSNARISTELHQLVAKIAAMR